MARGINRFTAQAVKNLTKAGRHSDGGNLYLSISPNGGRRWVFMFRDRSSGRIREMGLGSAPGSERGGVSLADARKLATKYREALSLGKDPFKLRAEEAASAATAPTFGEAADGFLADMESQWSNAKHRAQWKMTLTTLAKTLRDKPVNEVETTDVLEVLKPLWKRTPETAERLRGRIERVLDAAKVAGHRSGENPARWRGHLEHLLPKRQRLTRGHHTALPYGSVPELVQRLQNETADAASALVLTILTACRTGEVLGARWSEIDLKSGEWAIPAERMKAGKPHRVPLSAPALSLLKRLREHRPEGDLVFPGAKRGKPLSSMAMLMYLRRMKAGPMTVHGFRSSFRDWTAEATSFPHEVCEMALAHVIENKAEAAYRRGELFAKRRKLMEAWATYCTTVEAGNVRKLHGRKRQR